MPSDGCSIHKIGDCTPIRQTTVLFVIWLAIASDLECFAWMFLLQVFLQDPFVMFGDKTLHVVCGSV